jgi:hypothetical protein
MPPPNFLNELTETHGHAARVVETNIAAHCQQERTLATI